MRHFNFETNIQERMPQTGKVFFVKRMTADYAECYPFDVDGFIEDIYQKYQQIAADDPRLAAWAKTREELRQQWVKTLSVTRPSGDATIYPNRDGRQEPALMEVWHKAGDYWRAGLRIGDTLPKIVPPCRITRLPEGGWIALFPNEMHLLESRPETTEPTEMALAFDEPQAEEESNLPKIDGGDDAANDFDNDLESVSTVIDAMAEDAAEASAAESAACEAEHSVLTDDTEGDSTDENRHQCDVDDVTAEASPVGASPLGVGELQVREQEATETNASAAVGNAVAPAPEPFMTGTEGTEGTGTSVPSADAGTAHMEPVPAVPHVEPVPTVREILAERRHQRRLERERMQRSYEERMEREAREAEQAARDEERRKIFAAVGAVAVTAVMIYFFGLLGPAVFGLLCGGLLKG